LGGSCGNAWAGHICGCDPYHHPRNFIIMKTIDTLIKDVYELVQKRDGSFSPEAITSLSEELSKRITAQFSDRQSKGTLRLSAMGSKCPRRLWYEVNHPEMAEQLPSWATIKYTFGHILEAMVIALVKSAGHTVTGEQDELLLDGIVGHRDCVIDGVTVDVKSASTLSFNRFKGGSFTDSFGYLDQLDGYVLASKDDPLVINKSVGYILAIDKQLGHMCLYKHEVSHEREKLLRARISTYKQIAGASNPPTCQCGTISQGSSGNIQLDFKAGYSPYKHCCNPHLRTFLYSSGPVYLTKVVKRPMNQNGPIVEVDRNGKIVYT